MIVTIFFSYLFLMDNQPIDTWSIEGSFTRNYTIFGLLIIVLFCGLFLLEIWVATLLFFVCFFIFFLQEYRLHSEIQKLLSDPTVEISFQSSIIHGILMGCLSCFLFALYLGIIHIKMFDFSQVDLIHTYIRSLVVSLAYFTFFHSAKRLLIGFRQAKLIHIACGCFAILHRITIFLRFVSITPFWLNFFISEESIDFSIHNIINSSSFSLTKIFILSKLLYLSYIVWDLDCARRSYLLLYHKFAPKMDLNDKCILCNEQNSGKMIPLKCGHVICSDCASKTFNESPFCPKCGILLISKPPLSFYDGEISFSAVFCCF